MALLNIWSLTNKSFLLNDLISTHSLIFTLVIETWLDKNGAATLTATTPFNFIFSITPELIGEVVELLPSFLAFIVVRTSLLANKIVLNT